MIGFNRTLTEQNQNDFASIIEESKKACMEKYKISYNNSDMTRIINDRCKIDYYTGEEITKEQEQFLTRYLGYSILSALSPHTTIKFSTETIGNQITIECHPNDKDNFKEMYNKALAVISESDINQINKELKDICDREKENYHKLPNNFLYDNICDADKILNFIDNPEATRINYTQSKKKDVLNISDLSLNIAPIDVDLGTKKR